MVERIRTEIQRVVSGEGGGRRMSQSELDAYRRQLVLLGVTVTAILLVLILGIGAYYQYLHLPRQTVASVAGEDINRADYWDYRRYELLMQINQYQQMAQFMEGDQAQQYQQLAIQANQEFENVEDASIDPVTLDEMINNRIIMDALDEFGIEITEQEIDDYLVTYFTGTPIGDEPEGVAPDPTAEAWATATAEAQQQEAEEQQQEMEDAESEAEGETGAEGETEAETENSDEAIADQDDAEQDDEETDVDPTPEPEPTPSEEEIRATAEANQSDHQQFLLDRAGISHDQFVEIFIMPDLAREKIQDRLAQDVPVRAEQVQAAHILVATEDAANLVYEELTEQDADFAEVAAEQSTDQQTAPNGGDLGWFPRGVMVDEFNDVVFDLDVGEISEPFQTEFGWHIATVLERDDDRPVELQVLQQLRQQAFQEWLAERRESVDIDTDIDLPEDPGAQQSQFQPPASAPQPPAPEPPPEMEPPVEDEEVDDIFDGDDPFESSDDED